MHRASLKRRFSGSASALPFVIRLMPSSSSKKRRSSTDLSSFEYETKIAKVQELLSELQAEGLNLAILGNGMIVPYESTDDEKGKVEEKEGNGEQKGEAPSQGKMSASSQDNLLGLQATDCLLIMRPGPQFIPANSERLSVRSPFFAALFQKDSSSNRSIIVNLPCPKMLEVTLHYLYKGELPDGLCQVIQPGPLFSLMRNAVYLQCQALDDLMWEILLNHLCDGTYHDCTSHIGFSPQTINNDRLKFILSFSGSLKVQQRVEIAFQWLEHSTPSAADGFASEEDQEELWPILKDLLPAYSMEEVIELATSYPLAWKRWVVDESSVLPLLRSCLSSSLRQQECVDCRCMVVYSRKDDISCPLPYHPGRLGKVEGYHGSVYSCCKKAKMYSGCQIKRVLHTFKGKWHEEEGGNEQNWEEDNEEE